MRAWRTSGTGIGDRKNKLGEVIGYRVKWRVGGGGVGRMSCRDCAEDWASMPTVMAVREFVRVLSTPPGWTSPPWSAPGPLRRTG